MEEGAPHPRLDEYPRCAPLQLGDALRPRRLAQLLRYPPLSHNAEGTIQALLILRITPSNQTDSKHSQRMELKKIKLNKLSDDALAQRQMKGLKGGSPCCSCGYYYEYSGGASTHDNGSISTMKRLVFIAILFLVSTSALLAQRDCIFTTARSLARYRTLDTARYLVRYRYISKASTQQEVADEDVVTLQIGDRYTKSYSENLYQTDSVATIMLKKGARVLPTYSNYTQREDIYTCLEDKSVTTVYRMFSDGPVLRYQEPLPQIKWELSSEKKTILGYSCQLATCRFRGRNYSAWFTLALPLSAGPWKFSSLPGLILEIYDDTGEVKYTADEILHRTTFIKLWNWPYTDTTREKANQTIARMFRKPTQFLRSIGAPQVFTPNGPLGANYTCPYNPIELE